MDNSTPSDSLTKRGYLALALVVVATAVTWLAWLGWDTKRTTDPVTQNTTGPYEPWQMIGCGLTLLAIAVLAAMRLPIWPMVIAITATRRHPQPLRR